MTNSNERAPANRRSRCTASRRAVQDLTPEVRIERRRSDTARGCAQKGNPVARLFTVNFFNNGPNPGSVMLFQRDPDGIPNAQSLAWFAKYNYPQTRVSFE